MRRRACRKAVVAIHHHPIAVPGHNHPHLEALVEGREKAAHLLAYSRPSDVGVGQDQTLACS